MSTTEELEARLAELEERLSLFEAKTGFMSAETMLENTKRWVAENVGAWNYLKQYARKCVESQRRFSIQKALEELREAQGVTKVGDVPYKMPNAYGAVLVRMLCKEVEGLSELVTMRHSKVDRLFR